jgi:serine/threonine protein kinase/tetratricopeptide (TPR) repeat protein
MLSTHWEEVKNVFEAALLLEEGDREAFVASRCGGDHELAQEVHSLLAADRESSKFLEVALLRRAAVYSSLTEGGLLVTDDTLCGRFRVLAYLGEGGMGQVFKAVDLELKQQIAIKVIRPDIANIPGVLSRFKREVNATRAVTHPNVCRTFDLETHIPSEGEAGRLGNPITFLTMELLVGETLAQRIRRTGPLPLERVRNFTMQIAHGLQAAHSAGVIHCDLKPSNIFLSGAENDPRVVVTDFGIAKLIRPQEQTPPSQLTASGMPDTAAVGTPFYMAPEQIETGDSSPASDLYSFGLVIYEALTAQKLSPYRRSRNEIETTLGSLDSDPSAGEIHAIEQDWIDIIARCVQPNPSDRFESADQLLNSLEAGSSRLSADLPPNRTNFLNGSGSGSGKWHRLKSTWNAISWPIRALGLSIVILVPSILLWRDRPTTFSNDVSPPRTISSVAILPIVDRGTDSHMDALAEGITLNLTNDLAQVSGLRVPSQSTVNDLGKAPDIESIRRKLNVDTVVNGTIVDGGSYSMLHLELVDVRTGFQLWGQSYTRKQMEDPSLAEDIAQEITYQLRTHNDKGLAVRRSRPHSTVPAAETAYVQGQSALAEHTYAGFERAVKFFQQAIDADPNYAAAIAELSRSYVLMAINNGRPEPPIALLNQAESTARRALRVDSTLAAAYTSLAQVEILRDYNWSGAEEDFKRAEEVEPDYIPAHLSYALNLLTARGRFAEARAQLTYADRETPKTLGTALAKAAVAYYSRKYESSASQIEQIRSQFHTSAVAIEFEAEDYLALNSPARALKVLEEAPPDPSAPQDLRDALRGIALAQLGQRQRALSELNRLERSNQSVDSSYYVAALCAHLGDKDKAFAYLEKSREDRKPDMLFLGVDPLMDPLRSDPRFKLLLSTLNLL